MGAFEAIYSSIRPALVNPALLVDQAAGVFGERLVNVDTGDTRGLGVHLARVEEGDAARWEDILKAHDGAQQTPAQIEEAGRQMDVWRWEESAGRMIDQAEADIAAMGSTTTVDEMRAFLVRALSRQVVVMRMLRAR